MKKGLLAALLLLLTGCGYLPSITPTPTVTVTVTATPTSAIAPSMPKSSLEAVDEAAKKTNQSAAIPTTTPNPTKPIAPSKDVYVIRFEGKTGVQATGIYTISGQDFSKPTQIEKKEGILPFSIKTELPSKSNVGASLVVLDEDPSFKVFISKNGKECGKVLVTGSAIPNAEASKSCSPEQ